MSAFPSPSKSKSTAPDNCPNSIFVEAVFEFTLLFEELKVLFNGELGIPKIVPNVIPTEEIILSLAVETFAVSKPSGSFGEKNSLIEKRDEIIEDETVDCAEPTMKGSGGAETGGGC